MKRYIRASADSNKIVSNKGWYDFLKKIEEATGMKVDSAFKRRRKGDNWIQFTSPEGEIYEAEITEYSDGSYELLNENIRKL